MIKTHVGFSYQMIIVGEEKELSIQFNQMKEHLLIMEWHFHIEPDLINLESSGTEWLWSSISSGNAHTILIDLDNPKSGINFSFEAKFKGNYINDANFSQHKIKLLHGSLDGTQIGSSLIWSGNSREP